VGEVFAARHLDPDHSAYGAVLPVVFIVYFHGKKDYFLSLSGCFMSCKDNKKVSGCLSRHPEIVEKDRGCPVYVS
jgi:hypothetical protein